MLPPILTDKNLDYDDESWDRSSELYKTCKEKLFKSENFRAIGKLIDQQRGGVPEELLFPKQGSFNVWLRLKFVDGGSAGMRFPLPGRTMFPEEKTQHEASVMRFLTEKTSIPVPLILHVGTAKKSPDDLGPFVIMEYIEHEHNLVEALNTPNTPIEERPILNPSITIEKLHLIYGQMAEIMLQVSKHNFTKIGSISLAEDQDSWEVNHRPLTMNMNELVQLGNVSPEALPQVSFETTTSFYVALASMHKAHLLAIHDKDIQPTEFRSKYIARCLFHKLAKEGKFCRYGDSGPYHLFSDDFRPANVVANANFQVTGAIDWEFSYTAPPEIAKSAPHWLLLEYPEFWPEGLDDWTRVYDTRLPIFLNALCEKEDAAIDRGILKPDQKLSPFVRDSWETGDFWVNYAARRCWAFDEVYWRRIDRRFFGTGTIDDRLKLLTSEERKELDWHMQRLIKAKTE